MVYLTDEEIRKIVGHPFANVNVRAIADAASDHTAKAIVARLRTQGEDPCVGFPGEVEAVARQVIAIVADDLEVWIEGQKRG